MGSWPESFELAQHRAAFAGIRDRIGADDGEALADRHQYIGVVCGQAVGAERVECDDAIAELRGESGERCRCRSWRTTGVGDAMTAIEDEAAGTLEKLVARLERAQVDGASDEKACAPQLLDRFGAAFRAARRRHHRIEHDGSVGMEADPVVREAGVGLRRLRRVFGHVHFDTGGPQAIDETVEFAQCRRSIARRGAGLLEAVRRSGFRVRAETRGADHQHRVGALRLGHQNSMRKPSWTRQTDGSVEIVLKGATGPVDPERGR